MVKCFLGSSNSSIPALTVTDHDDKVTYVCDDSAKANLLNSMFVEVTHIDDDTRTFPQLTPLTDARLNSIRITTDDIIKSIDSIPLNKTPGPDAISPYIIQQVKFAITPILLKLFNRSLSESVFPSVFKLANVIPVHKKGSRSDPCNYRPISLTSVLSKIFEKTVSRYLLNYFLSNNLIYKHQAGFLPGHSTAFQLVEIYNTLTSNIERSLATSLIFCDISRAFDRLSHPALYSKLIEYGLSIEIRNWLLSFLSNRKQRTVVNGIYSDWGELRAGVAQGSVLGPLLFLLMINDLPTSVFADTRLFADDTMLLFTHDPRSDISDYMTEDMRRLQNWADTWMIKLNPDKTYCMTVTLARNKVVQTPKSLGKPISNVHSYKYLGLFLNDRASWSDHINYITNKVSKRIGVLRYLKYKLNRKSLMTIYTTHIRSVLEYCDIVWDNCTVTESLALERIQNECLRIITGLPRYCSNDVLLAECGVSKLSERRHQHRLISLYKIITHRAPAFLLDLFPPRRHDPQTRNSRHHNVFMLDRCRTETYRQSFVPRTAADWNALELEIRNAQTLNSFKRMIQGPITIVFSLNQNSRRASIIYTCIKHGCSRLHEHLFNHNLIPNPVCECGLATESVFHFLYDCPLYDTQRFDLLSDLTSLGLYNLSIDFLFDESRHESPALTTAIQSALYRYFLTSGRF